MAWTVLRIAIGVAVAVVVYLIGASMLRKFHMAPPAEPDPEDIKPVDLHFRCIVCGARRIRKPRATAGRTWSW
jgi:hypothetical protein